MPDGGFDPSWQCSFGVGDGLPGGAPEDRRDVHSADLDCSYDMCGAPMGLSFQCSAKTGTWIEGFGDVCAGAN